MTESDSHPETTSMASRSGADQVFSASDSGISDPESQQDSRTAGFWRRAGARIIDAALGAIVGWLSVFFAVVFLVLRGTPGDAEQWAPSLSLLSISGVMWSILGSIAYFTVSEWTGNASFGKLVFRLRVMSEDFGRAPLLGTVLRSFAYLIDGLFFGLVAYASIDGSHLRQRLGDRWGKTVVVRTNRVNDLPLGLGRAILGAFLGLLAWTSVCALAIVANVLGST